MLSEERIAKIKHISVRMSIWVKIPERVEEYDAMVELLAEVERLKEENRVLKILNETYRLTIQDVY